MVKTFLIKIISLVAIVFFAATSNASGLGEKVGNFVLLDQHGDAHELHYNKHKQAMVLLSYDHRAAGMQDALDAYLQTYSQLKHDAINFYLLDVNPEDSRQDALHRGLPEELTVMFDEGQLIADALNISRVGEALVINPKDWSLVYRGPGNNNLRSFLSNVLTNDNIQPQQHPLPQTYGKINHTLPSQVASYSQDIAPLLREKCVSCHSEGGIGPFAMNSYEMVRGFAPMIREVILTKRMPPWHADPHVNHFADDMSLNVAQKQQLVGWINANAPRGDGEDPLLAVQPSSNSWILGEPDLVIELPAFDVPATGSVDYQFFETPYPLNEDKWVKAIHIIPGERAVVHHAISTFGEPDDPSRPIKPAEGGNEASALLQQQLMIFVPGNEYYIYPEDTALKITKGSSLFTQMHYTTSGKASRDISKIGLYFRDTPPEHILRHFAIADPFMTIPPGVAKHAETAYWQPDQDVVIYSLFPHAHYRGRSSTFTLRHPDGRDELLLSVPNYDFNWQRYFRLEQPLEVKAGSMIIHTTIFDNSPQSDTNPDPEATVPFGLQSWEEMLFGGVSYRNKEGGLEQSTIEPTQFQTDIFIGALDTNLNGRLELAELPENLRKRIGGFFAWMDANQNQGLENAELKNLFDTMRQRAQQQQAQ